MNTETLDESTSPAKKRDYIGMLDFVAAAAAGQSLSKWLVFHDGPSVSGLLAGLSYLTGGGIGYVLCYYLRTHFTKNLQTRGAVIFASIVISLGLALAIITATVLLTKPAGSFDATTAVPFVDPFDKKTVIDLTPTDAMAQNNLGGMYLFGRGVTRDVAQAVHWFRKAADQGNATAQHNLGGMYRVGSGVPQDYAQAVHWYRKAANQGFDAAQNKLGFMYDNGQGVPKDVAQAVQWYRKAADQGDADAQNNLGVMYDNGQGVPKDYAQAVQWYRKAADQDNATAQYNLGVMYYNGQGVPKDYAEAVQWFILAKASGNKEAEHNLALAESKATPAQIAEAQKLAREWWAAHHPGQ